MRDRLLDRLEDLRRERERGLERLSALQAEQRELARTLLRIQGAIQVLEEELAIDEPGSEPIPITRPR